jgi:hypothetical protein
MQRALAAWRRVARRSAGKCVSVDAVLVSEADLVLVSEADLEIIADGFDLMAQLWSELEGAEAPANEYPPPPWLPP